MASPDQAPHDSDTQTPDNEGLRQFGDFLLPPLPTGLGTLRKSRQSKRERERVLAPVLDNFSLPFRALAEAARRKRSRS